VFTAVARTDRGLRWTAVTIDSGDNARAALDRISVPQDVLDRIAPTALPRSSLIISDEPLNRETKDIPTNKCYGYGGCCRGVIL
jgi:hypothetical protein